jgi:RimJ/RimL family protein N-acetyltransferase
VVAKRQELAEGDEAYVFGIFRKSDYKHVGKVEFCTIMRDEFQWGLLGYTIHNQYWRKGYGKEAVKDGLDMAFKYLGFHRIEAHINVDNIPSIRLAESIGLTYECTRRKFIYEFENWTDNLIYYSNSN